MATVDLNGWENHAGILLPTSGRKAMVVTIMDSTETERGTVANPFTIMNRRKWQVLATSAPGTALTTSSTAAQILALSGSISGANAYDRIMVAINVTAFTQTSGTDRSVSFLLSTFNPGGADPTAYTLGLSGAITSATTLAKQTVMGVGVGIATSAGYFNGDFMDGVSVSASFGAVAAGTCTLIFSYTLWGK